MLSEDAAREGLAACLSGNQPCFYFHLQLLMFSKNHRTRYYFANNWQSWNLEPKKLKQLRFRLCRYIRELPEINGLLQPKRDMHCAMLSFWSSLCCLEMPLKVSRLNGRSQPCFCPAESKILISIATFGVWCFVQVNTMTVSRCKTLVWSYIMFPYAYIYIYSI